LSLASGPLSWLRRRARSAIVALLNGDLYFAFQAFRMRKLYSGVRFQNLVEWANEDVNEAKAAFLATLIETLNLNESQLRVKQKQLPEPFGGRLLHSSTSYSW
jgi:hypothetical protein